MPYKTLTLCLYKENGNIYYSLLHKQYEWGNSFKTKVITTHDFTSNSLNFKFIPEHMYNKTVVHLPMCATVSISFHKISEYKVHKEKKINLILNINSTIKETLL